LPEGLALADIDAVGELWFKDRGNLARFFQDSAYLEVIRPREISLMDGDGIRAVVAKMHVVHDEFSFQPSTVQPLPFNWD
jgi:EthD domain